MAEQDGQGISADWIEFLTFLGALYLRCGKLEKALVVLEALHALCPEDGRHHLALAYCHLQAGDYESALTLAGLAMEAENAPQAAALLRARALLALERQDEARRVMQSVLTSRGGV